MQEDFRLILDIATVLAAAAAGGLLAALLRQPVLLGYLLAGILVGPTGLGWIKEVVQVETLAQFGVTFLLFTLGVEFSLKELRQVRGIALGGLLQIGLTIAVTAVLAVASGWLTPVQGIFLGRCSPCLPRRWCSKASPRPTRWARPRPRPCWGS